MMPEATTFPTETEEKFCINCNTPVSHTYCSKCGQMYETDKISIKSLLKLWYKKQRHHIEVFLFTTRGLILKPGTVVEEYWSGKKKRYYNPLNYFILIGSLMAFVMLKFGNFDPELTAQSMTELYGKMGIETSEDNKGGVIAMQFMQGHFNLVMMGTVPFYALALWILMRRRKRNWGEMMIPILFCMAIYFLLSIFLVPFIDYNNPFTSPLMTVSLGLLLGIWAWIMGNTFRLSWWRSILLSVGVYLFAQVLVVVISFALALIAGLIIGLVMLVFKALK